MKTLYLECAMGASGDMLMSALSGLLPDKEEFVRSINALPLPGVTVTIEPCLLKGISGLHADVKIGGISEDTLDDDHGHEHSHDFGHEHEQSHDHDHAHGHEHSYDHDHNQQHSHDHGHEHPHEHAHAGSGDLHNIYDLIDNLPLSAKVKNDAKSVYRLIADAESKIHGTTVELVHFHEVGALDAVCDIVGVCLLFELIAPDMVIASPVHVGSGSVMSQHGRLPVPAPATAELLKDIPIYGGDIAGELCTPTGAALLKYFVDEFSPMPQMVISKIGYGMGTKDFPRCNCLRAFLGSNGQDTIAPSEAVTVSDTIAELSCNIDDMTPEAIGYASELMRDNGALEVFIVPAQTKKNRPTFLLNCLCKLDDEPTMVQLLLKHTTTFGLRRTLHDRYTLSRCFKTIETKFGPVKVKYGEGYGTQKCKPEYDDMAVIAKKTGLPISKVYEEVIFKMTSNVV